MIKLKLNVKTEIKFDDKRIDKVQGRIINLIESIISMKCIRGLEFMKPREGIIKLYDNWSWS